MGFRWAKFNFCWRAAPLRAGGGTEPGGTVCAGGVCAKRQPLDGWIVEGRVNAAL
jgi:hypothetical protein